MNFKTVIKNGALIGGLSLIGVGTVRADSDTKQNMFDGAKYERMSANRKIAGNLLSNRLVIEMRTPVYNPTLGKYVDNYETVLEYHVDTNGDNNPDYVLKQIIPDGTQMPEYNVGTVLEFTESAHENGGFYIESIKPLAGYAMIHNKTR